MNTSHSSGAPRRHRGKDRRPRRKESPFRLTPARREAGVRNLKKATLARMMNYYSRHTPPEAFASSLRALKLADAARAVRGNYFRHGLYSALLPAAIERAGESIAEFNAHMERFARAFSAGPGGETLSEEESRLVRAAAELVWRHIRAYRCQGEWERARIVKVLGRLDGYRIPYVQQAADVALKLVEILSWGYDGLAVPLGRVRRRLEGIFRQICLLRFGWDPQFKIFRRGRHKLPDLEGLPPELAACPVLAAWRVERVQDNQEMSARDSREAGRLPEVSRWSRARRKEWTEQVQLFGRIFLGREPPPGSRLERATNRLVEAVAWRLQPFPRQAEWQATRVREIVERAAGSSPLTPRRMYATMRRILEAFDAGDRVFDHLPRYDHGVVSALKECLRAAYRQPAHWDPLAMID
jgi:hypothetical protein